MELKTNIKKLREEECYCDRQSAHPEAGCFFCSCLRKYKKELLKDLKDKFKDVDEYSDASYIVEQLLEGGK